MKKPLLAGKVLTKTIQAAGVKNTKPWAHYGSLRAVAAFCKI